MFISEYPFPLLPTYQQQSVDSTQVVAEEFNLGGAISPIDQGCCMTGDSASLVSHRAKPPHAIDAIQRRASGQLHARRPMLDLAARDRNECAAVGMA
jgi:hypothetical protein